MGIFEEIATTDALGRRSGPRKRHPLEEKRRIVEETLVAGASVAVVARRNHVPTRTRYLAGDGSTAKERWALSAQDDAKMLPVEVSTPTILPTERATAPAPIQSSRVEGTPRRIEIRLRNGHGIVLHGWTDDDALLSAIDLLLKR